MVEGYFDIGNSTLSAEQKTILHHKLKNKINGEGILQVRSQVHRSQLSNKMEVVKKMEQLLQQALRKEKARVPTKPSRASKIKRLENKKRQAEHKVNRQRVRGER